MRGFSEDVLHRATFLHERDVIGAVAGYTVNAQDSLERIESLPQAAAHLAEARCQLTSRSASLASGEEPHWITFFTKLAARPADFRESEELRATSESLDEYFRIEAYAFPFLAASQHFILEIARHHGRACSAEHAPSIYATLSKWYVSRVVEASRFVLHLTYSRSGLSYPGWCELFHQLEAPQNPWWDICAEFPVLVRWLATIDRNTRAAAEEMFRRLDGDREDLDAGLAVPRRAKVSAMEPGLSDPHRGGRTVMRLTFDDGSTLIYKPKPLTIEAAFNEFAGLHSRELGIVPLKVLTRAGYGWVEDAGDEPREGHRLQNPGSIGRAAACFWLLNATDLHFENVRPGAEGVHALDTETLLVAPAVSSQPDHEPRWRHHSVNTTLLFTASVGAGGKFLNISGFNPSPNLSLPSGQVQFEVAGDAVEMTVVPSSKQSQPGQYVSPVPHAPTVVAEVVEAFRAATAEDGRALVEDFALTLDDNCPLRFVIRDTYFYGRLLERMRQPRFMRDGALLSLDLLLLHGSVPHESAMTGRLHAVVEDEIRQLLEGDIPYFSFEAGGLDLRAAGGRIADFFETSAKSHALKKVRELEQSDVDEQAALLVIAFDAYLDKRDDSPAAPSDARANARPRSPADSFLPPLKELAESIVSNAFRPARTPARWLSLFGDIAGEQLKVDVGDRGFFGGSWGILLALQAAENALSGHHDTGVLREFLDEQAARWSSCVERADDGRQPSAPVFLGFSGLGGDVFAQSTLVSLEPTRWSFLRAQMGRSLRRVEDAIPNDRWLDVIGGSAGFILGCEQLLSLGVAPESAAAAATAQQAAATHLINMATNRGAGLAWKLPKEKIPLLGFAHGWAGIVAALASAGRRTTSESQQSAIESCLREAAAYPQAIFHTHRAWRDYRVGSLGSESLNRSWCHGVPGFLRGMLEVKSYWTDEVHSALESTIGQVRAHASSDAYRFCCGEMGNIDFLLDYSRAAYTPEAEAETRSELLNTVGAILSFANNGGKKNRRLPELSFPGLFQGQAGLMYCAARFILPDLTSLSGHHMPRAAR